MNKQIRLNILKKKFNYSTTISKLKKNLKFINPAFFTSMNAKQEVKDVYRTLTPKSTMNKLDEQNAIYSKSLCETVQKLVFYTNIIISKWDEMRWCGWPWCEAGPSRQHMDTHWYHYQLLTRPHVPCGVARKQSMQLHVGMLHLSWKKIKTIIIVNNPRSSPQHVN